ncbi:MAG: hypothetical protein AAFV29_23175, partial [Myxococcota bacterium]
KNYGPIVLLMIRALGVFEGLVWLCGASGARGRTNDEEPAQAYTQGTIHLRIIGNADHLRKR